MAAAAATRLARSSSVAASAAAARVISSSASPRSTPTGIASSHLIPVRLAARPFSSKVPDPKKVAEELVNVLKEPPTEATWAKAESLVNELKSHYDQNEVKGLAARLSGLEKANEARFMRAELKIKYLSGFSLGTYFLFTASLMAVPAGFYYAWQDNKTLSDKVKTLTTKVDTLEGNKVPTKVEVGVKFPQD